MTRQAYVDRERRLLIFWSPKCGCSSLVKWWWTGPLGRSLDDRSAALLEARRHLREGGYRIKHKAIRQVDLPAFRKIAITRHPFDRAVSAYIEKFVRRDRTRLDDYRRLEPFAAQLWRQVRGVGEDDAEHRYDGLSFMEFIGAIERAVAARAGAEPDLNHHWNTQVPYAFRSRPGAFYDSLHDLRDLDAVLAGLNREYGFAGRIGAVNRSQYGAFDGRFLGDVSSLDLARSGAALSREHFRSPESAAAVRSAYEIDFAVLGYNPPPAA